MIDCRTSAPPSRKRHVLAALVALVVASAAGAQQQPPRPVIVAPVSDEDIAPRQTFVATVLPLKMSQVGSAASGRVEFLYVKEGQRVKAREPIAKLRTKLIEAEVKAARGVVAARRSELDEMKNGPLPEEIRQAEERLRSATSLRDFTQNVRKRTEGIGVGASREELERAISDALRAESSYQEARAALELLKKTPRQEKKDQAEARLKESEAELERLEEQLERHTIVAPFDCYMLTERCEVGQWLLQGQLVATVVALDEVAVQAEVIEDSVGAIRLGDKATVEVPSLAGRRFEGTVEAVIPQANVRARTFPVKVRVPNVVENGVPLLKGGQFARVTFNLGGGVKGVSVPKDALVLGGPKPLVYVFDPEKAGAQAGKVRPVPVELGLSDGNLIQVKGELKSGEQVVVEGNERLFPGQAVTVIPKRK